MLKNVSNSLITSAVFAVSLTLTGCMGDVSEEEWLQQSSNSNNSTGNSDLSLGEANRSPDDNDAGSGDSDDQSDGQEDEQPDNQTDSTQGNTAANPDPSNSGSDSGSDSNTDSDSDSGAGTNSGSNSNADTDSGSDTDTDSNSNAGSDTDSNSNTDSGTDSGSDSDSGTDSSQDSNNSSDSDSSTDNDADSNTDTTAERPAPKQEFPLGYAGEVSDVFTPSGSDPFSKFQLDDALYTNNVYDGRQLDAANNWKLIFYDGVQDFVSWEVPALVGSNSSPCARPQANDSPVTLSYRLTSRKDSPTERNTFVRAFPAMVVGSMGGRYESWGVECGQATTILPSVQRHGGSPVYQMNTVTAATGLPVLAGDLDYDIRVSVKADLQSSQANTGLANIFMDSYWHNVSDQNLVPGNESQLVNTTNGISSDYTEVWNLNIWFDYPRSSGRASSWTGGFKIGSITLNEGGDFDVYYKVEGSRDGHIPLCQLGGAENCFLYIGLVTTDDNAARNGITINYTEIADWMRTADFRDLFLTGAFESDTPAARAYESWRLIDGTDNDNHPDPAKRGPRFPDSNHVIGGIHLGSELWYNPDAVPASIEFETLGVEVEGIGHFGRYTTH